MVSTCILVKTGEGQYDNGYLDVSVDVGDGYNMVTTPGINYDKGSNVLDECFVNLKSVQVSNQQTNAWAGRIETSVNNKVSYIPMKCLDCDGTVDTTEYIVVDGDTNGIANTKCLDGIAGNTCTLVVVSQCFVHLFWNFIFIYLNSSSTDRKLIINLLSLLIYSFNSFPVPQHYLLYRLPQKDQLGRHLTR